MCILYSATVLADEKLHTRNGTTIVKDTADMEVVYVHIAVDPVKDKRKVIYEMLSIGDNFFKYGGYDDYQVDSIYMSDPEFNPPFEESMSFLRKFDRIYNTTLTDRNNGSITFYGKVSMDYFHYSEPLPEINWILTDESDEVMGYQCKKATARWRGRNWTAWYSDIPIDAGPWKFQGLPGLILKLEDESGEHYFETVGMKDDIYPFGYKKRLYSKSTREKFNAAVKNYSENCGNILVDSGMIIPQSEEEESTLRSRRLFYAPIELE